MAITNSTLLKNLFIGFAAQLSELIKDALLLKFFGVGAKSDVFLQAYMVISGLRNILGEGPLSKAFIPVLSRTGLQQKVSKRVLFVGLIVSILFFSGFAWLLISSDSVLRFFTPKNAFFDSLLMFKQTVLSMFPAIPLLFLAAICAVFLLSREVYWQMPAGPMVFNLVMILAIISSMWLGLGSEYLIFAVILAAATKFLFRFILLLFFPRSRPAVDQQLESQEILKNVLLKTTIWQAISGIVSRVNYFFMLKFATMLPSGHLTLLFFAHKVVGFFFHSARIFFDNTILVKASIKKDPLLLKEVFLRALPILSIITGLCVCFSDLIMSFAAAFSDKIVFGATAIQILGVWAAVDAIARMQRNYFYAAGKGHLATVQFLSEVGLNIILSFVFVVVLKKEGLFLPLASLIATSFSALMGFVLLKVFEQKAVSPITPIGDTYR